MSGHGVVSKHSAAAVPPPVPSRNGYRMREERRQRKKRRGGRDNGHIGHIELAAIMWDKRTHTHTREEAEITFNVADSKGDPTRRNYVSKARRIHNV